MSWKPWREDVAAELKAKVRPKFIKLHPMSMELVIDERAKDLVIKDNQFMKQLQTLCETGAKKSTEKMKGVLDRADKHAEAFTTDGHMAGMFLRPVHMEMEKYFDEGSEQIQKAVVQLFKGKLKTTLPKITLDLKFGGLEIPQD